MTYGTADHEIILLILRLPQLEPGAPALETIGGIRWVAIDVDAVAVGWSWTVRVSKGFSVAGHQSPTCGDGNCMGTTEAQHPPLSFHRWSRR